jgi:hypothetical protein
MNVGHVLVLARHVVAEDEVGVCIHQLWRLIVLVAKEHHYYLPLSSTQTPLCR